MTLSMPHRAQSAVWFANTGRSTSDLRPLLSPESAHPSTIERLQIRDGPDPMCKGSASQNRRAVRRSESSGRATSWHFHCTVASVPGGVPDY
jgi:hypothetical protein